MALSEQYGRLGVQNVEDLLFERGIDLSHETIRFWWNRFGPMFAREVRQRRVSYMRLLPFLDRYVNGPFFAEPLICPQSSRSAATRQASAKIARSQLVARQLIVERFSRNF